MEFHRRHHRRHCRHTLGYRSRCHPCCSSIKTRVFKFNTMASSVYGRRLNPYRRLRDPLGVKGVRQSVVVTNNPSTIDQNQQLLVRFPNLGAHDVIVPGTARLAFTVSLTSTDANQTIVQNLGRAIVKKMTIKIPGNEVLSIDDSDVFHCYLTASLPSTTTPVLLWRLVTLRHPTRSRISPWSSI